MVVALAALLVSGMLWREQVQVRRIENQRLVAQAQWVARGGLDWTRLVLRSEADTAPGITWLGGVWTVPIARTRLSELIDQGSAQTDAQTAHDASDIFLSGSIEDAQARFNLRNLAQTSGAGGALTLNAQQVGAFARLLSILGLDAQLARPIAQRVRAGLAHSATRFQPPGTGANIAPPAPNSSGNGMGGDGAFTNAADAGNGNDNGNGDGNARNTGSNDNGSSGDNGDGSTANAPDDAPLMMTDVDALRDVPGVTPEVIERLRPFVVVLPTPTPVNLNTAPPEVIAALVPGLSLPLAQAFAAQRDRAFLRNLGDAQFALQSAGLAGALPDTSLVDVTSSYFIVHARIENARAEVNRSALVWRDPFSHTTQIVRVADQS